METQAKLDDSVRYAEWIVLLLDRPFENSLEWARTVLMRLLETNADCHYRHDDARLKGKQIASAAQATFLEVFGFFEKADQNLFLRVMLLTPW